MFSDVIDGLAAKRHGDRAPGGSEQATTALAINRAIDTPVAVMIVCRSIICSTHDNLVRACCRAVVRARVLSCVRECVRACARNITVIWACLRAYDAVVKQYCGNSVLSMNLIFGTNNGAVLDNHGARAGLRASRFTGRISCVISTHYAASNNSLGVACGSDGASAACREVILQRRVVHEHDCVRAKNSAAHLAAPVIDVAAKHAQRGIVDLEG